MSMRRAAKWVGVLAIFVGGGASLADEPEENHLAPPQLLKAYPAGVDATSAMSRGRAATLGQIRPEDGLVPTCVVESGALTTRFEALPFGSESPWFVP